MKPLIVRMLGMYLNTLAFVAPQLAGKKGFLLFCRPFRQPITKKQKQFFNTADKFYLSHEDQLVQCYKWGSGAKKVLFLHGWQSHTYRWKLYIESFPKEQYTIYSIDAPGHGLSSGNFLSVPLYSSVVERFIKENGPFHTVVGHSVGGFTLLYTLYRLPLLEINKIVLLAPPGEADDFISVFKKTLKISDRTLQLVINHFVSQYDVGPDFFSTMRFAPNLNVRGLIIHDEDDNEAPYQYSIPLHKTWDKSRLITTKGFGHNLRSITVVKDVMDFINEEMHQPSFSERF